ncbi:MAG TPA: hypothetical protein VE753_03675 [Gaiellaceae bacterium]|jgi:hypothetical protein|nr:hypothetical protein [Gaiellaceae bacterium]
MRRLLVTLVAAAVLAPVAATAASAPALRLIDPSPFTVRGTGFKSHERVLLVAAIGRRYVRTIRASAAGSFTAVFREVNLGRCQGFAVHAIGSRGSRAALVFRPQCPPPPRG